MKRQIWISTLVAVTLVVSSALVAWAAQGTLPRGDMKFASEAATGGLMEVQLGQLAQQNADSADVKQFGQRMVTDHGKANDELKALAQQKNLTLPTELKGKHKSEQEKLSKTSGANFDRMYMGLMVKDHVKDVADFRKAATKVKDPDLNAWSAKTLPVLEQHLQQAREIAQKLGIKSK